MRGYVGDGELGFLSAFLFGVGMLLCYSLGLGIPFAVSALLIDKLKGAFHYFTVVDQEGNAVSLSDFLGKSVILNFWASWCGPYKGEMPDFETAYHTYGEEIQSMMVNLTDGDWESIKSASGYVEGEGYTFPIFFGTEGGAANVYNATSIPVTYFVNGEGHLVAYGRGALSTQTLQSGIDMLLSAEQ